MAPKPVNENELDNLFNEIERITNLYVKVNTKENFSDQLVRAAILKNIPENVTKDLTIDLRKATSADDMQHIIIIHMHDNRTRLQRGVFGLMICAVTEPNEQEQNKLKDTQPEKQTQDNTIDT